MSVLALKGLRVAYGEGPDVLRGVDLALGPGESYGLVGESGCGKSTIAYAVQNHLAAGRITGGRVFLGGRDVTGLGEREMRRLRGREVAMVYQDPVAALNPVMRIGRQLAEAARARGTADRAEILRVLDRVRLPEPERFLGRWPHQLSGGQLQRVVIAMALLARPRLLILDEPTTGLDVTVEAEVVRLIAEIAAEGDTALLYISHNLGLIARVARRIGVMYAGRLVEEGPARAVLRAPAHPYTRALIDCLPGKPGRPPGAPLAAIPGQVPPPDALPAGCVFAPRCHSCLTGRCTGAEPEMAPAGPGHAARCVRLGELAPPPRPEAPPPGRRGEAPPLLTLDRIEREFGRRRRFGARPGVRAADGVSFAMRRGETLALVGESGSGKSTLARLLIGLDRADAGTADFGGRNIAALPAERRPAALIRALQMVFQNPDGTLNPAHRVGRILARALRRAGRPHGPEQVAALLDLVRLPPEMAGRRPGALSGGQRQRVAIARAFAGEPELILADEPVSALDVSVQAAVVTLLGEAQAARDTAILLISHDLMLVRHVADRVVVLYRGRVMEQGTAAQVFSRPSHPYTEALMAAVHPPDPDHEPPRLDAPDDPGAPPQAGCPFQPRCHRRVAACADTPPPLREQDGHAILCHHERAVLSDPPSRRGAVA